MLRGVELHARSVGRLCYENVKLFTYFVKYLHKSKKGSIFATKFWRFQGVFSAVGGSPAGSVSQDRESNPLG